MSFLTDFGVETFRWDFFMGLIDLVVFIRSAFAVSVDTPLVGHVVNDLSPACLRFMIRNSMGPLVQTVECNGITQITLIFCYEWNRLRLWECFQISVTLCKHWLEPSKLFRDSINRAHRYSALSSFGNHLKFWKTSRANSEKLLLTAKKSSWRRWIFLHPYQESSRE